MGHYKVYQAADTQALTKRVQKLLSPCRDTLKETVELEDYDEEGAIPLSALKESFATLDIHELTDEPSDLLDFILYILYQKSESLEKIRYSVLFELIDGKLPGLNATSSEGGRKRPESSSPEKLKARNKEKFNGSQGDSIPSQQPAAAPNKKGVTSGKNSAKHGGGKDEGEDNYEEEFEKLLD